MMNTVLVMTIPSFHALLSHKQQERENSKKSKLQTNPPLPTLRIPLILVHSVSSSIPETMRRCGRLRELFELSNEWVVSTYFDKG
jgi:hypothetical protein